LMEKVMKFKFTFPWPIGSSLPSMILAGLVYSGLVYWLVKRKRGFET